VKDSVLIKRIDPRRPAVFTAAGLRRIVLGSDDGERLGRIAHAAVEAKPLRSAGPFRACIVVIAHTERGALDEHAREAIAAAALLARADEAVRLLALGDCRDDLASTGVDDAEVLALGVAYRPHALAMWVQSRCGELQPRHVLLPDRGADADLGRRLAALAALHAAAEVVELSHEQVRVRAADGQDACAPLPPLMLLKRHAARAALPFVGHGRCEVAGASLQAEAGIEDLGLEPGDPQSVPLEEADFIVAAGNGVSDVALFNRLAQTLGAATGASRVAVDDGRFARSKQVGATGKTVQARGYLAIGISGAVQHLQGIKDCRHVIAINTDGAAPIAQRAELTVVDDAQPVMQALLGLAQSARARPEDGAACAAPGEAGRTTQPVQMASARARAGTAPWHSLPAADQSPHAAAEGHT
jgi:electron transfer flavoprotein alpha subunit